MCEEHHCPKVWVCYHCTNSHEALCPACAFDHLIRTHNIVKMVTVESEIRKDSEALKAKLGPDSPAERIMLDFKQKVSKALRGVAEATREGRAEIGRAQRELDLRKKDATLAGLEAQRKLGELLKQFGMREAMLEKIRTAISGKAQKLEGKRDEVMKEIKRLLEQAGKETDMGKGKMEELLAGLERVTAEIKKVHEGVRPEFRSRVEKERDLAEIAGMRSNLRVEQSKAEGLAAEKKAHEEKLAKMEKEKSELEEILKNWGITESLRSSFASCGASINGFKPVFEAKNAAIDQQQDLAKKWDMIKELDESLKKVEDEVKLTVGKVNEQLGKMVAKVRKNRQVLDDKDKEVKKRVAEEGKKLLAEYTGQAAYAKVTDAYQQLAANTVTGLYFRPLMLIIDLWRAHAN